MVTAAPTKPTIIKPQKRRRTPTVLQMEAVECGAASLAMILAYHGKIVPLAELREVCGISRDGSKATNILAAARNYGLQAKGFKADLETLHQLPCPYIVFWNFNHFLIVEGIRGPHIFLNDPATGSRKITLDEFSQSFTGVVLVFETTEQFERGGKTPSQFGALWQRLNHSIGAVMYCVAIGLLLVLPGLAMPAFSQVFVDQVLIQGRQEWLRPLILGMIGTALLTGLLTRLQLKSLRQLRLKLAMGMSSQFLWHLLHLPTSFYDQRFAGEISSRIQLNDRLAGLLSGKLATTVISLIMVVFYAVVMWQYDRVLTLIGIVFVVINLLILRWVSRQRADANIRLMQEQGKVSGVAIAGLQSIETLKASGLESDFFKRWAGYYAKSVNVKQSIDAMNQSLGLLPSILSGITLMLLLTIGGLRVMDGALTIGMLIAFQSLMQQFMQPVGQLISLGSDLQELEGTLNRLDDVLQNPTQKASQKTSQTSRSSSKTTPKLQGHLRINHLTFGYNRASTPLIEDFHLDLKPGQRVALVGGSGSGKSTIAKIVAGLYEPWSGEIQFDGQPKSNLPAAVITNSVAMIEQDILLFTGSVRDNLTLWDSTIPERNLIQACRDACIHDVILSMPGGYNADLREGASNLSGGQRQRLEIARALVNNPAVLIMDEATSALDTETERQIDYYLRLRGCTCLIVAHRLSTIRDCDEIIVLEYGKVVQRGTHEQLAAIEGHYLDLIQTEGESLEDV
jgi:ATP-binding cassette, subfamily C, bacterial